MARYAGSSNVQQTFANDTDSTSTSIHKVLGNKDLTNADKHRLKGITEAFDFYEGYHWENIAEDEDAPQVTTNYCRLFVDKFVAFELGKGFTLSIPKYLDGIEVTVNDPKIVQENDVDGSGFVSEEEHASSKMVVRQKYLDEFLEGVWESNNKDLFAVEMGQMKAITGDAWIHPAFMSSEDLGIHDPFNEYPNGKISVSVVPSQYCFPKMDSHDKDLLVSMFIMYPVEKEIRKGVLLRETGMQTVLYKEYWTVNEIVVYEDDTEVDRMENPYGFIPFVHIKNFPEAGRIFGISDLADVIPMNVEYNIKNSDVSNIIDYHAAPITCVFGSKIGSLEKGANKVWGGMPKDARVENLSMQGDLVASQQYIAHTKTAMCEVGNMSENMLGGVQSISNTSGVALHYMNMPLEERANVKRMCTSQGLEIANKMIISIALYHGLIAKPENISMKDFLVTYVTLPDSLPKDELLELQKIQMEMLLRLECRHGALERLGREDIKAKLAEIDVEAMEHPEVFNSALQPNWYANQPQFNSGMMNSETPEENLRIESTGQNGGDTV